MKSRRVIVPHCPNCRAVELRNTPPTRTGCYRICSTCNHMWHVPAEVLRGEKPAAPARHRAPAE